ncbi:MAG: hypothetical protein R3Y59_07905 [bacterium]
MKTKQLIFCIALLCAVCSGAKAQTNEKYVGISSTMGTETYIESVNTHFMNVSFFYEHKFSKHFSYDLGMGFKQEYVSGSVPVNVNFVSIPLDFKFNSNIVNVGLGASFDIYTNIWGQNGSTITSFNWMNAFNVGLFVSKNINITEQFILEPEVRFQYDLMRIQPILHLGMKLKYKL